MAIGKNANQDSISFDHGSQQIQYRKNKQEFSRNSDNEQNGDRNFDDVDGPQSRPSSWMKGTLRKSFGRILSRKISEFSSTGTEASSAFQNMNPGCSFVNIFMLRILFWDILISGGDVITDFLRVSYQLSSKDDQSFN